MGNLSLYQWIDLSENSISKPYFMGKSRVSSEDVPLKQASDDSSKNRSVIYSKLINHTMWGPQDS